MVGEVLDDPFVRFEDEEGPWDDLEIGDGEGEALEGAAPRREEEIEQGGLHSMQLRFGRSLTHWKGFGPGSGQHANLGFNGQDLKHETQVRRNAVALGSKASTKRGPEAYWAQ